MAIEINVVNGIVNISTDGEVPRSYYGAVGASGSVMPMKAHLLGDVTEYSWVSAQEYSVPAGSYVGVHQDSSSGLGTGAWASFTFVDSATPGATYISSIVAAGLQNGKYRIGDSLTFVISYIVGMEFVDVPITVTVKSLAYERVLIKIGGDFYEENWYDLVINGTSPTEFSDALSLISSAFASVGSPYKVYSALLTQSGDQPPVATVLQNTIGDIEWSYNSVGTYIGTLLNAFPLNKTFILIGSPSGVYSDYSNCTIESYQYTGDEILINTISNTDDLLADTILAYTTIEIRVYN